MWSLLRTIEDKRKSHFAPADDRPQSPRATANSTTVAVPRRSRVRGRLPRDVGEWTLAQQAAGLSACAANLRARLRDDVRLAALGRTSASRGHLPRRDGHRLDLRGDGLSQDA